MWIRSVNLSQADVSESDDDMLWLAGFNQPENRLGGSVIGGAASRVTLYR